MVKPLVFWTLRNHRNLLKKTTMSFNSVLLGGIIAILATIACIVISYTFTIKFKVLFDVMTILFWGLAIYLNKDRLF